MAKGTGKLSRYSAIIEKVFGDRYEEGEHRIPFSRQDLLDAAVALGMSSISNIGDVIYSKRSRSQMPQSVLDTQPEGREWVIRGIGRGEYAFQLVRHSRVEPNENLAVTKVPDSTPEIVAAYALNDEQALLAKVRYNRLLDVFLGMATYSLQNHLRTTVKSIGQIEIDEIYIGVDKFGCQYVVPVQAKGGKDTLSVVQMEQDIEFCTIRFPNLTCRAIATQFMAGSRIALFELNIEDDGIRIVEERHYQLVPSAQISEMDLSEYRKRVR